MKFSRQEYWSGLPFPPPGDPPNAGIKPRTPALQADSLPSELFEKPLPRLGEILENKFDLGESWLIFLHHKVSVNCLSCYACPIYATIILFKWGANATSVQFSRSVMFNSLRPHEPQHARPPCPSPTPCVHTNPCPLSCWCHPTISSSVVPFSSCPQSFPASMSFPMSQFLASGGQRIGVSASASVLPMNTQDWSPLGWTGWISWQSKGLSTVFSNTTVQKHQFFGTQLSSQSNSHPYMTTGKPIALTRWTFIGKVMSLLLNMLSRLVITFLPSSKRLLISWLLHECYFSGLQNLSSSNSKSFTHLTRDSTTPVLSGKQLQKTDLRPCTAWDWRVKYLKGRFCKQIGYRVFWLDTHQEVNSIWG